MEASLCTGHQAEKIEYSLNYWASMYTTGVRRWVRRWESVPWKGTSDEIGRSMAGSYSPPMVGSCIWKSHINPWVDALCMLANAPGGGRVLSPAPLKILPIVAIVQCIVASSHIGYQLDVESQSEYTQRRMRWGSSKLDGRHSCFSSSMPEWGTVAWEP